MDPEDEETVRQEVRRKQGGGCDIRFRSLTVPHAFILRYLGK